MMKPIVSSSLVGTRAEMALYLSQKSGDLILGVGCCSDEACNGLSCDVIMSNINLLSESYFLT